jgi:hypothetical protein
MFHHHKELAYTVRVDKPNPVFARMLQQAIGGPEGEMRVMNQYRSRYEGHALVPHRARHDAPAAVAGGDRGPG